MANKIKCYSVRLDSLISISEKAYKATAFNGSTAIIPKSQVFGQDEDVQKSRAWWISAWALEQKELQYSTKKVSYFDAHLSDRVNDSGVEIERHIPDPKEPVVTEPDPALMRKKEEEYNRLLRKMRQAVENKEAKVLTIADAERLKGKRIQTIYFGYRGQDGVDDFVVGDIVEKDWIPKYEPKVRELLRIDGTSTFIRNHFMDVNEDVFSCSDIDRFVFYLEVEEEPYYKQTKLGTAYHIEGDKIYIKDECMDPEYRYLHDIFNNVPESRDLEMPEYSGETIGY